MRSPPPAGVTETAPHNKSEAVPEASPAPAEPPSEGARTGLIKRLVAAALAIVILVSIAAFVWIRIRSAAARDPNVVTANGTVEGTEITVSAKIPGRLASLRVDESDRVRKGHEIARLDADDVRARVRAARAQVDAAAARRMQAEAGIAQAQSAVIQGSTSRSLTNATTLSSLAQAIAARSDATARYAEVSSAEGGAEHEVHAARAAFVKARDDLQRAATLTASGDLSRAALDAARAAYEAASAQRDVARRGVDRARETIVQARADIAQADAVIAQAKAGRLSVALRDEDVTQLRARGRIAQSELLAAQAQQRSALADRDAVASAFSDTRIIAPVDGTVLRVVARSGETVAAGEPILTLVDTTKLYVRVYVSETDAGRVRLGDGATITVDAFPQRSFRGTVSQIDESAQFTPKTVHMPDERTRLVYGVKVALSNAGGELKPGMIADARIAFDQRGYAK